MTKSEKQMPAYMVTCRSCGTDNRIPADKEGMQGRCGNCRKTLPPMYYQPMALNAGNFDAFLASYPGSVLAEFWAPW